MSWLQLANGDTERASTAGRALAADAMRRRDRAVLGEALELQAMCAHDSTSRARMLNDAASVWQEIGSLPGLQRVIYAISRLGTPADAAQSPNGVAPPDPGMRLVTHQRPRAAGLLAVVDATAGEQIEVRVLGKFAVLRGGRSVDDREWQSRKARELLRILVARRGRPIAREALAELLWPDEEPDQLSNRLSVALAIVRRIFDPSRDHDSGHYLRAEDGVIALDLDHIHVDVEAFLQEGAAALSRHVEPGLARRRLQQLVDGFAGEPLGEDLYADWAVALRDEAHAMFSTALRALIRHLADSDDGVVPYLTRLIEVDPYDEPAHTQLISSLTASGRYGAARRAHERYAARMSELGVSPAPFTLPPRSAYDRTGAAPGARCARSAADLPRAAGDTDPSSLASGVSLGAVVRQMCSYTLGSP
jgi:DNA-binding SARP family transcriptional activator